MNWMTCKPTLNGRKETRISEFSISTSASFADFRDIGGGAVARSVETQRTEVLKMTLMLGFHRDDRIPLVTDEIDVIVTDHDPDTGRTERMKFDGIVTDLEIRRDGDGIKRAHIKARGESEHSFQFQDQGGGVMSFPSREFGLKAAGDAVDFGRWVSDRLAADRRIPGKAHTHEYDAEKYLPPKLDNCRCEVVPETTHGHIPGLPYSALDYAQEAIREMGRKFRQPVTGRTRAHGWGRFRATGWWGDYNHDIGPTGWNELDAPAIRFSDYLLRDGIMPVSYGNGISRGQFAIPHHRIDYVRARDASEYISLKGSRNKLWIGDDPPPPLDANELHLSRPSGLEDVFAHLAQKLAEDIDRKIMSAVLIGTEGA